MPVVNTTRTFTTNEQINATKLNDIMDQSTFVAGAVVSGQGLEVTGAGQMQIGDGLVAPTKLSTGAPSWNTTTVTIPNNASISGTTTLSGAMTIGTATMPVPTGGMPLSPSRAWANFDISTTTVSGTINRPFGSTLATFTVSNHGYSTGHFVSAVSNSLSYAGIITKINDNSFSMVTVGTSFLSGAATLYKATINSSLNIHSVVPTRNSPNSGYAFNFETFAPSAFYCALFSIDDKDVVSTETEKSTGYCKVEFYDAGGNAESLSSGSHDAVFFA